MDVFKFSREITPVSLQGIILITCGKCNTPVIKAIFLCSKSSIMQSVKIYTAGSIKIIIR